ncbi:hypothetical protein ACQR1W_21880 [Bradyrhizobium sp. HKCCYLS1011]|uniref:hypothetical protein n=1 Tax=Bradyrhizobium sp. HKCCYLS1011 TaxID=3420733 RepID=UPI003EBC262A
MAIVFVAANSAHLFHEAEHGAGRCDHAQCNDAAAPDQLLTRGLAVMESEPVLHKSRRDVEDDCALLAMMRFVLTKHRPDILHAEPLKLAMPLPGVLTVRPAIFEGDSV